MVHGELLSGICHRNGRRHVFRRVRQELHRLLAEERGQTISEEDEVLSCCFAVAQNREDALRTWTGRRRIALLSSDHIDSPGAEASVVE